MLRLLTIIPTPKVNWSKAGYRRGVIYFPFIGLLLSGLIILLDFKLEHSIISGFFIYYSYLILTGGIHLDGYADTIDGFLARTNRERTLEILHDVHLGTFGVVGLIMLLVASPLLLAERVSIQMLLFPVVGRTMVLFLGSISEYARKEGMGKEFTEATKLWMFALFSIIFLAVSLYFKFWNALIAYLFTSVVVYLLAKLSKKKIGGITGDIVGFCVCFSEWIYLLIVFIIDGMMV